MFISGIESTEHILDNVKGKKILFLSPAFFEYEKAIVNKMREMGAHVDYYDERSVTTALDRALLKVIPSVFNRKTLAYYEQIINNNNAKDYDYILVVKCDMVTRDILDKFRGNYPNSKLCLYLWDSIDNIPGIIDKIKKFDTAHSFDIKDCKRIPSLKFRPLFFSDEYNCHNLPNASAISYDYDLCFAGTIHSDRYSIIKKVKTWAENKNKKFFNFCYLQSRFIYYFYKFTKKEFRDTKINDFSFEKMPTRDMSSVVLKSEVVLDAQHPKQTGLTMRTIEMLGMGKKLITTNKTVELYDFYDKDNIYIIDRDELDIDEDFFNKPYRPIDNNIYKKYMLESWILEVLS